MIEPVRAKLEHFTMEDFRCKCCGSTDLKDELLIKLQALRYLLKLPITVNSAYRCPVHNKAVNGVDNSEHTKGQAVDISFKGTTLAELQRIYETIVNLKMFSTVIFYKKSKFIHVDVRQREENKSWEWMK